MKKTIIISAAVFAYCILHTTCSFSQGAAINSTGNAADNSAMLDVSSTAKGLLIPRMTTTERNLILSPANGLLIFNTTTNCFEAFVSNTWNSATCPSLCLPPASPGAISGNTTVCENAAGEVYSVSSVNNASSYMWSVPAGASITSGQGTTSVTVTFADASGDISVMAGNICGFSTPSVSAITVLPYSPVSVSIAADPSGAICAGTNVDFTATPVNGGSSPSYQWKLNGGDVGTNSSIYSNSSLVDGDEVSCIMTSNAMCSTGSPTTSDTIIMSVTTVPAAPTEGTHVPDTTQIVWNWNTVSGATGYKWHTTNDYNTAEDMGTATSKTDTGLTCNTAYTSYVWAYNSCGYSSVTNLTQSTLDCAVWTQFVSDTWPVAVSGGPFPTSNCRSALCYHGVVNTDQLVMSTVYCKNSTDVVYYIRGIVFDLTNGTFNVGSEYSWGVKPNDFAYKSGVAGDGQYGVTCSNTTGGVVELRGFTITNYSSCNQTTAPLYSFAGSIQHWANNNNGGGITNDIIATRSSNRYIASNRQSNDRQIVRSYTYNGSTFTAEGAANDISGSNGIFESVDYFANPGGGLNWGIHISTPDANRNYMKISKVGSGGYDASDANFYTVAKSSVVTSTSVINDVAGDNKSVVIGECANDAFTTARIVTTSDFTSGAVSYGAAYTSSAKYGFRNLLPYSGTKVFQFTISGTDFITYPINVSGSVLSWGSYETISTNNVWSGFYPGAGFRVVNAGITWYFFCATYSSSKVIAVKYTP